MTLCEKGEALRDVGRMWRQIRDMPVASGETPYSAPLADALRTTGTAASTLTEMASANFQVAPSSTEPFIQAAKTFSELATLAGNLTVEEDKRMILALLLADDLHTVDYHIANDHCRSCRDSRRSYCRGGFYPLDEATTRAMLRQWTEWEDVLNRADGILDNLGVHRNEEGEDEVPDTDKLLAYCLARYLSDMSQHFDRIATEAGRSTITQPKQSQMRLSAEGRGGRTADMGYASPTQMTSIVTAIPPTKRSRPASVGRRWKDRLRALLTATAARSAGSASAAGV